MTCAMLVACQWCVTDAAFLTVQMAGHTPSSRCATPGDFVRQAEQHKAVFVSHGPRSPLLTSLALIMPGWKRLACMWLDPTSGRDATTRRYYVVHAMTSAHHACNDRQTWSI